MPSISIQFHALPEEILKLVQRWVATYPLHATAIGFSPFQAGEVQSADLDKALLNPGVRRLMLTLTPPNLAAESGNRLLDQNPEAMILDIGCLGNEGLNESWLTTRTGGGHINQTWKQIAGNLKSVTKAGALAINRITGAQATLKNHRFTPGAKALAANGVVMLPTAGNAILRFPK